MIEQTSHRFTTTRATTSTTSSTTSTTTPFSMPSFFGALLTAPPPVEVDDTFETVTVNPIREKIPNTMTPNVVHHFHHSIDDDDTPSMNIKEWYVQIL